MNKSDRILVTGARGLVGSAIVERLRTDGFANIIAAGREDCDLTDVLQTRRFFEHQRPDYVFHAAARVYGLMGNMKNQALSFYDNVMINTNVIDSAYRSGIKKIAVMGTGAIYPFPAPGLPLREEMIFMGEPHFAASAYANSKRAMLMMLRAYEDSYKLRWAYIISCNLFGPRDKFDAEYGQVVPALIRKFYEAKKAGTKVVVWGDGSAQRDFMHISDTARLAVAIMDGIDGPVNSGSGSVYSIREIVEMIAKISGMEGRFEWDPSKPNGQDYRAYELSKINALGFKCAYSMYSGLQDTWDWFCRKEAVAVPERAG
jgi:GDP-L-fucose synthase